MMAKIERMMVGEALVGDGNEVAHVDLIIGPRGSPAETAFAISLVHNKDGFTSLLAVVAPNLLTKRATARGARDPGDYRATLESNRVATCNKPGDIGCFTVPRPR